MERYIRKVEALVGHWPMVVWALVALACLLGLVEFGGAITTFLICLLMILVELLRHRSDSDRKEVARLRADLRKLKATVRHKDNVESRNQP